MAHLALISDVPVAGGRLVSTRAFSRRRVVVFAQRWEVGESAKPVFGHGRTAFAHPHGPFYTEWANPSRKHHSPFRPHLQIPIGDNAQIYSYRRKVAIPIELARIPP